MVIVLGILLALFIAAPAVLIPLLLFSSECSSLDPAAVGVTIETIGFIFAPLITATAIAFVYAWIHGIKTLNEDRATLLKDLLFFRRVEAEYWDRVKTDDDFKKFDIRGLVGSETGFNQSGQFGERSIIRELIKLGEQREELENLLARLPTSGS